MPRRTIRGDGKREPLNMRTTAALRRKIERAAGQSGRSLVQEVEYRIEQTFHGDEALCEIALLKRDLIGMLNVLAGRIEQLRQAQAKAEGFWRDVVVAQQHMGKSMQAMRSEANGHG